MDDVQLRHGPPAFWDDSENDFPLLLQQFEDIRALPQEAHSFRKAQLRNSPLELVEVFPFFRPLRTPHHPAEPRCGEMLQSCQSFQVYSVLASIIAMLYYS